MELKRGIDKAVEKIVTELKNISEKVSGKKEIAKEYMSFSGFVGGHKSETFKARQARHPELLIERAVRGMIPHNKLGRAIYTKLKVYKGDKHPHASQQPAAVTLGK